MNSPLNLSLKGCCFGWFLLCVIPLSLRSEVVASYTAPSDPSLPEWGWTSAGRAGGGTEVDKPEPAWRIAPNEGNALSYAKPDAEDMLRDAFTKGWKYSARVRLDPSSTIPIGRYVATLGVENAEKKESFVAWVRTDESDGTLLVEFNRTIIRLPDLAADAYHDYAIIYDPASSRARLTVDGQAVAEDIPAVTTDRWFLRWGHSSVNARGVAEWASLKFEVPAPDQP